MPYVALLITSIIWGLSAIVAKEAFTQIDPWILLFLRFAIAAIVTSPLIFVKRDQPDIRTKDILKLSLLVFLATGLSAGAWVIGIYYTTATHTAIISAIGPILVLPLERILLKKTEKPIIYGASALGLIGAVFTVVSPLLVGEDLSLPTTFWIGDLLVFVSALSAALYTVLVQKEQRQYLSYQKTALAFTVAWVVALPFALVAHYANPEWIVEAGTKAWVGVIYFGLGSSAIAYLFWQWAAEKVAPVKSSLFFYLQPVITLVAAFFILHEVPGVTEIIGGVFILIAVATVLLAQNAKDKV